MTSDPFIPPAKIIIRYFTYASGYKDYCISGKDHPPDLPEQCPFCQSGGHCLVGHGWYRRKELVAGYSRRYGEFYIYRCLCKVHGKTISLHPEFTHHFKRFLLETVLYCLYQRIYEHQTQRDVASFIHVSPRTIRRWEYGFCSNEHFKRLCFFPPGSSYPCDQPVIPAILTIFFTQELSSFTDARLRLFDHWDKSLY